MELQKTIERPPPRPTSPASQSVPLAIYQATLLRPLSLLLRRIFLPVRLRMRHSQPCRLFCTRRVWPFIVLRGPQRIWLATPASAGCEEIAPRGTTSAVVSPAVVVAAVEGSGVKAVRTLGRRIELGERLGRSGERVVNVLWERSERVSFFTGSGVEEVGG